MKETTYTSKAQRFAQLPPEWPEPLLPNIQKLISEDARTLVILDDDPTGTQTVANLPILTEWSVASLCAELQNDFPAFYILTNTRSLPEAEAVQRNREVGQNLLRASRQTGRQFSVVSRSDSTLRGHFPGELDALTNSLHQQFDGWLLIPFFLEGGRFTIDDVHFVQEGDALVPAGNTPFAQDGDFGYESSNLRQWVAEKSSGRFPAEAVQSISLRHIRQGGPAVVQQQLQQVNAGQIVVVNAVTRRDLEVFTLGLLQAEEVGKRFLYRTAASFVQVRAGLAPPPLLSGNALKLPKGGGGLTVVGSYVPKTTRQLEAALTKTAVYPLEVQVDALLNEAEQSAEIARVLSLANEALASDADVLIFTSRKLVQHRNGRVGLAVGRHISDSLVQIVKHLSVRPRYIIAKGGITSSDIVTKALKVRRAMVLGQIIPGVPVWRLGAESRLPGMAYVVFPGNVGEDGSLMALINQLG